MCIYKELALQNLVNRPYVGRMIYVQGFGSKERRDSRLQPRCRISAWLSVLNRSSASSNLAYCEHVEVIFLCGWYEQLQLAPNFCRIQALTGGRF